MTSKDFIERILEQTDIIMGNMMKKFNFEIHAF